MFFLLSFDTQQDGGIWLSTGLPNRSGEDSDFFQVLVCPTGLEGFQIFSSTGLPNRSGGVSDFFQVLVCPTGLEGFQIFF